MSFFNKKEDVIDIELTQFGKYLLSKGKFKPVFYVFSDDEILYNNAYDQSSEKFNETGKETSKRIQRETQRLKVLYEHEGVETRVKKQKELAKQEQYNPSNWPENIPTQPVDPLYGSDYMTEERMGSDDRNLIRNFIGHSTIGEREVPSWDIEALLDGDITKFIQSSSSPNIGIKRPVIEYEIDHRFNVNPMTLDDPDYNITDTMVKGMYNGLEREFSFVDDVRVTVEEGVLVFSVIEDNVKYDLENFEIEFFEVTQENENEKANNLSVEDLRGLLVTEREYSDNANKNLIDSRYIDHYFEVLTDQDFADYYGLDLRSSNRHKLKDSFHKGLLDYYDRLRQLREAGLLATFADGDPIPRIPRNIGSMGQIGGQVGILDSLEDADGAIGVGTQDRQTQRPENENVPVSLGDEEDICDD